ncbi:hypothetical protein MOO46_03720 [Apilactobacillus apisilvae]|uniref:Uncharacterized protein n=1 Tax=Apilactobacillus apisilvae TaxID=2923364 RepID=A0ABY4PIP5_9LACO|nr:hypothetical protein [Apilactobacillus apisilvae]UQS85669.1 hypothetical protein MOO46_03720 [Apilactobacillus apisilvae]
MIKQSNFYGANNNYDTHRPLNYAKSFKNQTINHSSLRFAKAKVRVKANRKFGINKSMQQPIYAYQNENNGVGGFGLMYINNQKGKLTMSYPNVSSNSHLSNEITLAYNYYSNPSQAKQHFNKEY